MLKIGTLDTKLIFFRAEATSYGEEEEEEEEERGRGRGWEETGRGREEGLLDDPKTRLGIRQILIGKQISLF